MTCRRRTFVEKKMNYEIVPFDHPTCLECGDEIAYGRSDRLYCSDNCRNRHNNRIHNARKAVRTRVLSQLEKNYQILEQLLDSGVSSVDLSELADMGYNLYYSTSYRKIRGRNEYRCFDIRFYCTPSRIMRLERVLPAQKLKP